jgi:hypothetical protein
MTSEQFLKATSRAKWHSLMSKYAKLHEQGLYHTDEALDIFAEALPLTPPEFRVEMDRIIQEVFGEMPKAEFCDDNGNPCYSIPQLEKWFGHKIEQKDLERVLKRGPVTGPIHRIH